MERDSLIFALEQLLALLEQRPYLNERAPDLAVWRWPLSCICCVFQPLPGLSWPHAGWLEWLISRALNRYSNGAMSSTAPWAAGRMAQASASAEAMPVG